MGRNVWIVSSWNELTSTVSTSNWFFSRATSESGLPILPQAIVSLAAGVQHLSEQFGRRRFAVRAGNGDDWNFTGAPAEFELADHVDLARGKIARSREAGSMPGLKTAIS